MEKKTKIIIGAAVAVVLVLVIIIAAAGSNNNSQHNGEVTYTMTEESTFTPSSGIPIVPAANETFFVAHITLKNLNYDDGISANPLNFKLSVDGVAYTTFYSDKTTVSVEKGNSFEFNICFKVPNTSVITNAKLIWDGVPSDVVIV